MTYNGGGRAQSIMSGATSGHGPGVYKKSRLKKPRGTNQYAVLLFLLPGFSLEFLLLLPSRTQRDLELYDEISPFLPQWPWVVFSRSSSSQNALIAVR